MVKTSFSLRFAIFLKNALTHRPEYLTTRDLQGPEGNQSQHTTCPLQAWSAVHVVATEGACGFEVERTSHDRERFNIASRDIERGSMRARPAWKAWALQGSYDEGKTVADHPALAVLAHVFT